MGTAPITKNGFTIYNKGATPIEKNVIVVDEFGKEYEATYPKRARGLVKHGRARFIGENQICLTCPPNMETEDNEMSENTTKKAPEQKTENQTTQTLFNIDYILSKLAEIQTETSYLNEALSKLSSMNDGDSGSAGSPGNILGAEKAKAFGDIVRCRETTNQQMIKLYEKMYEDIINPNGRKLRVLEKLAAFGAGDAGAVAEKGFILENIKDLLE